MRFGRALSLLVCTTGIALAACGAPAWPGNLQAVLRYRSTEHALYIERVTPRGSAARAGLEPHDRVVSINGVLVEGLTEAQIRDHLHGDVGTRVHLRIDRDGVERDVDVERAPLE